MAKYTYICLKCKTLQEQEHSIMESPEIFCPQCNAQMSKKPGIAAVSFVGGGWASKS